MNNKQRKKLQRAIEHRAAQRSELRFERKIKAALSGCSLNVARATSAPSLRDKHDSTSVCLPEIALFNAGYRKSESITAR
ncbi:transcriptional regulator [Duffyella gerundensis]|uniref:transcriptional antitermination N peptide n=1 Tax=Duffyella gerundensis TaxID=1619313 RepID=UPI0021F6A5D3|nr:transcriptional regulator [Duffyella gerundensis]